MPITDENERIFYKQMAQTIRNTRHEYGISERRMSMIMKIPLAQYQMLESGNAIITAYDFFQIRNAFTVILHNAE